MSIDTQSLRQTAEKAQEHGVFNMDMHSETVIALLDELEAKGKLIAGQAAFMVTQEKWIKDIEASMIAATDRAEAAEKRNAELTEIIQGKSIAWESTTSVYVKFITDERYRRLRPGYQKWYKPYRCSNCAAGISVKGE